MQTINPNKNAELLFSHEINIKAYAVEKMPMWYRDFVAHVKKSG